MKRACFFSLIIISLFFALGSFFFFPLTVESKTVPLYFFYGDGCPHCQKAETFLKGLKDKYPLEIKEYEVFNNRENARLFKEFLAKHNQKTTIRVPAIFINDQVIIGYQDDLTTGQRIEEAIQSSLADAQPSATSSSLIKLPFGGKVNLAEFSLPLLTIVIGALDGFNPCAMWVLLFLIALLINLPSSRKRWLIGGTFLLASALIYFLLLSAWLNVFLAIGYVLIIRLIIGLAAVVLGFWQIRKFFSKKTEVCPVKEEGKFKGRLRHQVRKVVEIPWGWASFLGVTGLAIGVNLIEFFCSAGLPAIYTQILAFNQLSPLTYYLYLLLYLFVFMLDDLVVFGLAMITLSHFSINEKYNRWSTLVGGIILLLLGLLLIFKPDFLVF